MKIKMNKLVLTILLTVIAILILIPFAIMISTSFKSYAEITMWPPNLIPKTLNLENFSSVWNGDGNIKRALLNSIIVSSSVMIICIFLGSFAAYGVSRFNFKGKNLFLFTIILTQMFSPIILVGPMYKIIKELGLLNSYLAMIIPNAAFALPMTVWLLYGYLDGISPNLEEAAMLDGCTRRQAVTKIIMPLTAPGIITSGIFAFIVAWNDLLFARSFITQPQMRTISVTLTSYQSIFETSWHKIMAASVISVIPVFLLFIVIQKYLIKGLVSSGVKE
ncbi:MAG: carbohydrate ABC transporter permease [Bacilli bacterium]